MDSNAFEKITRGRTAPHPAPEKLRGALTAFMETPWVAAVKKSKPGTSNKESKVATKSKAEKPDTGEWTALVDDMNAYLSACNPVELTLNAPESLTVSIPGKGYSKASHLGGECFSAVSAYVGKRNNIIVRFEPRNVVAYAHMEMSTQDAIVKLNGFDEVARNCVEGGLIQRLADLSPEASKNSEMTALRDRLSDNPSFGSW